MTYIIAEPCIDIKDLSCVDVCPVDCIHPAERILVIDPEECIDCFAPDETFVTSWGLRTFAEMENQWCRVLTDDGFKPAFIKRFREKPLVDDRIGARVRGAHSLRRHAAHDAQHLAVPSVRARDADAFVAPRGRRADRRARSRSVSCRRRRTTPKRDGETYRLGVLHGSSSATEVGTSRRFAPGASPLRPALRRESREVQGLLRSGQLLAVPRRASGLRRHRRRSFVREPEAVAARDGGSGIHRRLRRRLARVGRRPGEGRVVAASLDRPRGAVVARECGAAGRLRRCRIRRRERTSRRTSACAAGRFAGSTSRRERCSGASRTCRAARERRRRYVLRRRSGEARVHARRWYLYTETAAHANRSVRSRRSSPRTHCRRSGSRSSRSTTRSNKDSTS